MDFYTYSDRPYHAASPLTAGLCLTGFLKAFVSVYAKRSHEPISARVQPRDSLHRLLLFDSITITALWADANEKGVSLAMPEIPASSMC